MEKQYTIQQFAGMAGVTPKGLRHYDRLGLLKPRRSAAGYRIYVENDLERLEQIAALTFVGLPLREVRRLLDGPSRPLAAALRTQRAALEEKRRLLDVAVEAIRDAERLVASGQAVDAAVLKHPIEVIDMQSHVDGLKQYFTDEGWTHLTRLREQHPRSPGTLSDAWRGLFREAESLLSEDPASEKCQNLGERWIRLWEQTTGGNPAVHSGLRTAWTDRENWPPEIRDLTAEFESPAVRDFIGAVFASWMKSYYTDEAWARKVALDRPETKAAWARLYEEARGLLDEDPASEKAQDLARRWCQLSEASAGADKDLQAGMKRAWEDRQGWPSFVRRHVDEAGMTAIAEWIGRAIRERRRST